MAEEQIIYLSPEEELTNVRERLEHTNARRIILVIPPQTKLRSLVAWRLLHSRTRELGKEILIISSDRQIRSVVKAAGFRVADSLESPSAGKSRPAPGTRPARTSAMSGRTSSRSRGSIQRESRPTRQREQPDEQNFPTQLQSPMQQRSQPNNASGLNESFGAGSTNSASSTFGAPRKHFGQDHDFQIDSAPSIRPLPPHSEEDEELDPLINDYNQAQSIRQAYQQREADAMVSPPPQVSPEPEPLSFRTLPTFNELDDDPFALAEEDLRPLPLPEQHASVPVAEIDTGVPDISDIPTDISEGEIEDLGDDGRITFPEDISPSSWAESVMEEPRTPGVFQPYEEHSYNNRVGNIPRSPKLSASTPNIEDEDTLMPFPEQPGKRASSVRPSGSLAKPYPEPEPIIQTTPSARPSGSLPNHGPQPIEIGKPKIVPAKSASPNVSTPKKRPAAKRVVAPPPPSRAVPPARKPASQRSTGRGTFLALLVGIIIILLIGALAYFVPTADVTLAVPSHPFSTTVKLTATASTPQHTTTSMVLAQTLSKTLTASDSVQATGSQQVGNAKAIGSVTFTNNGSVAIVIPSFTVLSTSDGRQQFETTDNVQVPPVNSNIGNTIPATIRALTSGPGGNVAANTITVIPAASLTTIQQDPLNSNVPPITSSTLQVSNPQATNDGGATTEKAVSGSDVTALTRSLNKKLQTDATNWLKGKAGQDTALQAQAKGWSAWLNTHLNGTPTNARIQEKAVVTPAVNQVAPNGSVSETLTLNLSVLWVSSSTLQQAASAALNAEAAKSNQEVLPQTVTLSTISSTPSSNGQSVSLSLTAKGQEVQHLPVQQISETLAGQKASGAASYLASTREVAGIKSSAIRIQVNPGFFPWMPFRPENIHVKPTTK